MPRPNGIPGADAAGRLLVLCWCELNYVWVRPQDVREGHTGVCGLAGCVAPDTVEAGAA